MTIRSNGLSKKIMSVRMLGVLCATLFLLGTIIFIFQTSTFGSPDEAGNDFFIRHLAKTGEYSVATPLTAEQLSVFHPRTAGVRGTTLVPASFVGYLQLSAALNHLGGDRVYFVLTPLLALLALYALFQLMHYYCSARWALLGTALIGLHPAWWQFQTLPGFHNGAFASLIVTTAWLLRRFHEHRSWRRALLVGVTYGLALLVRPAEILWTGPLVAIVLITQRGGWKWLLMIVGVTAVMQVPWLAANQHIYGSSLSSGYTPAGIFPEAISGAGTTTHTWWGPLRLYIPPGGWSWHWLSSAWWYGILLVPAWSAMALTVLIGYFSGKLNNRAKMIKLTVICLFFSWYLAYYGSWNLYPLEPAVRIGSLASYSRYWLPLYTAMAPGVVLFLRRMATRSRLVTGIVIAGLFASQITAIVWHPNSGMLARFDRDRTAVQKRDHVLMMTESSALIIAGQSDKYFINDRLTAFRLPQNQHEWELLQQIRTARPVYVYVTPRQYRKETVEAAAAKVHLHVNLAMNIGSDQLWEVTP
jgi:hypothetical protein